MSNLPAAARRRGDPRLHVYYNGYDYVIAAGAEAAAAEIAFHFGEGSPESVRADRLDRWEKLHDDSAISLLMRGPFLVEEGTPGASIDNFPAHMIVARFGRGYLASTEE